MTRPTCETGQVRSVDFKYEEDPSKSKRRPAVVIVRYSSSANRVALIKVTSHGPRPECNGEVTLEDWAVAGLSHKSTARCSKVAWAYPEEVVKEPLLGVLSDADLNKVYEGMDEAGTLDEKE